MEVNAPAWETESNVGRTAGSVSLYVVDGCISCLNGEKFKCFMSFALKINSFNCLKCINAYL